MIRRNSLWLFCALVAGAASAHAQEPLAHRFIMVAPGVYSAVGTGVLETRASVAVIVNQDDVVLVDTNITPEATRRLVSDIRTITDKPVRTVINSHWHYDHVDGNQVFGPDVQIIGHANARTAILDGTLKNRLAQEFRTLPGQIAGIERQAAAATEPARQAQLTQRAAVLKAYQEQLKETVPTGPSLSLTDRLTMHRGGREIQIFHPGRGHSDGDLLVYLPAEQVLITGDFFEGPVTGALNFGFHDEWVANLETLKAIDYRTVIPGHGQPFSGKERIDYFQSFLRDLWQQARMLYDGKVSVADAARRIDLTAHKAHFAAYAEPGIAEPTVARLYAQFDAGKR